MIEPAWTARVEAMEQVAAARRNFAAYLRGHADVDSDVDAAELIFAELLSNALRYGPVQISLDWLPHAACLRVHDRGEPFRPGDIKGAATPTSERGRGLFLVQRLATMLTYERDGNGNIATAVLPVRLGASAL